MKILIYTDEKYAYQAKALIESMHINGKGEIPVIYYTVGFDSGIEFPNLIKKRWELNPKHRRFPFYKPEICLDALINFGGDILFLDSDILISRRFDANVFSHNYSYPLLSIGNWEHPYFYYTVNPNGEFPRFSLGDRVNIKGDSIFGIIESLNENNKTYNVTLDWGDKTTEVPDSSLADVKIKDTYNLMRYYGVKKPTMTYLYSCCIGFNDKCLDFVKEWKAISENEYLNSFDREYYPVAEETAINVTLWKNNAVNNYGRIFVNTLRSDVAIHVEKTDGIKREDIFGEQLCKCEDSDLVQFYHGMIDQVEIDKVLTYFKESTRKTSIYLDDLRTPTENPSLYSEWTIARNYEDFIALVESTGLENIEVISLDHDLDPSATRHFIEEVRKTYTIDYSKIKEKTGLDAAKWLVSHSKETGKNLPKCYTHSANPIGSGNITGIINLYLKLCRLPESCIRTRWGYIFDKK